MANSSRVSATRVLFVMFNIINFTEKEETFSKLPMVSA